MSRQSADQYNTAGRLINGYDYVNQAWVIEGRYTTCGHPETMTCDCYGRKHNGETTQPGRLDGSVRERDHSTEHPEGPCTCDECIERETSPDILTGPTFSQYYTQRRKELQADLGRVTRQAAHLNSKTALGRGTLLAKECYAARIAELDRAIQSIGPDGYPAQEESTGPGLDPTTAKALRETFTTFKG